jgi:hypothetical protein
MMSVNRASGADNFEPPNQALLLEMELADILEKYVAWLATEYKGSGFNLIEHHFDLSGYRSRLRDQVRARKITESQASHSFFLAALLRARKMSQVIIDNNICSAKLHCLYGRLKRSASTRNTQPSEVDENELRSAILRKHTEKWQELSARLA